MRGCGSAFDITPDAEISLEANPGSLSTEYLRGLRDIGFNRLSIGVQSFDDEELVSLDRIHTGRRSARGVRVGARGGVRRT